MNDIDVVLGLLVVVATLATIARRIGVPSPIRMVLGGIAIGEHVLRRLERDLDLSDLRADA